ncbi:hypothetical protein C4577_07825 [Candidatus Parcubacteria bacterium]|nr:MAG: hypothetical protein C4577_07825 [Candidatus Parcubacteria bacterium]
MAKQKVKSTTQSFIEILDVVEDIVLLKNGNMCSVINVSSVNFYLLSREEQNARIAGYVAFLNSLSFPIQIIVQSKGVNLSFYLKLIDQKIASCNNSLIIKHLNLYKDFIQQLTKGETLLDKNIYIVIPFSYLELGAMTSIKTGINSLSTDLLEKARPVISSKQNNIITQVQRLGLYANVLKDQELIKLLYGFFNEQALIMDFNSKDINNVLFTAKK